MNAGVASSGEARVVAILQAAEPIAALAQHRIALRVGEAPLRLGLRMIHGVWDPLLRRIELHGVHERGDAELVSTFAHELLHALEPHAYESEAAVQARAIELAGRLDARDRVHCAARLRAACPAGAVDQVRSAAHA